MDQSGQIILKNIINFYGSTIYQEKKKLEALIRDLFPQEFVRERNALIITVKAGLIENYFVKQSIDCSYSQLFHLLTNDYCLDPQLSNWVIRAWRYALGDDSSIESQNKLTIEKKIKVNIHEFKELPQYGSFLTNYIWVSNNNINVILSLFGNHQFNFHEINRFNDQEKFEFRRSIEIGMLDGIQKSDFIHYILNFDINKKVLKKAINLNSTKNISITKDIIISGGKTLRKIIMTNDQPVIDWSFNLVDDYGAITPAVGDSSLITVLYSTEWELFNWDYTEPNPSIPTYELVNLTKNDGKIINQYSIPYENTTTYSNLCIGDVFYLDHWKYNPYLVRNIIAINIKTGKILWESEYIPQGKINDKPFFIYSSSIIADGDFLYYCLGKKIIALDRITGNIQWEHTLPEMPDEYYFGCERRIIIYDYSIIIAGLHEVKALNKITGEVIWVTETNDPDLEIFTSNPVIYKDNIIIGGGIGDGDWEDGAPVSWINYYFVIINALTGKITCREPLDFGIVGNPGILRNKLYCWRLNSLIEISLLF